MLLLLFGRGGNAVLQALVAEGIIAGKLLAASEVAEGAVLSSEGLTADKLLTSVEFVFGTTLEAELGEESELVAVDIIKVQ